MKKIILYLSIAVLLTGCGIKNNEARTASGNMDSAIRIEQFKNNHPNFDVRYSLDCDVDGDGNSECIVVCGKTNPEVWFLMPDGETLMSINSKGMEYGETFVLDRGKEKHIAVTATYAPSNTKVWIFTIENGKPVQIFQAMADWDFRIISKGFDITTKKYQSQGGYSLTVDRYFWDEKTQTYVKQKI